MTPADFTVVVQRAIEVATAPLLERIKVLEARAPIPGPPGKDGADGLHAPAVDVDKLVERVRVLIPTPKDGIDGKDGRDGIDGKDGAAGLPGVDGKDAEPLDPEVVAHRAAELIPRPSDGEPGRDGKDGASVDVEALRMSLRNDFADVVVELVDVAVKAVKPEKGEPGIPGERGPQGEPGRDGTSLKGSLIDKDGNLVFTYTDGQLQTLGRIEGRDGKQGEKGDPGVDGKDGMGFEHFAWGEDEHGRLTARFVNGDEVKEALVPCIVHRGIWKDGDYLAGDAVTWDGSVWIAVQDTTAKPAQQSEESRAWRLCVKHGERGMKGQTGDKGPKGDKGDKGDRGPDRW